MKSDGIAIEPGAQFERFGSPVNIISAGAKVDAIDPFYAMLDGVRNRIYPGTGHQVELGQLGEIVRYVGGNIGMDDNERVDLVDGIGNWTSVTLGDLFGSSVWARLSDAARSQISDAMPWSAFAKKADAETLRSLPADIALACQLAKEGRHNA